MIIRKPLFTALFLALASCAPVKLSAPPIQTAAGTGPIDPARLSEIVRTLASDEFEGRGPGTAGEEKTVEYLSGEFERIGMVPGGESGGWTQTVPLLRTQLQQPGSVDIAGRTMKLGSDVYLSSIRPGDHARITEAPMVFVGFGVSAPERQWDDFKGVDLKDKVAIFLVNDPDFGAEAGEPVAGKFGGKAMTYYGRWTYKFEEAARRGAIAAIIVHETAGAGYGWNTVQAPGGENYDVVRPAGSTLPVMLQGWIQRDIAADLFKRSGLDLEMLKREARTTEFRPRELKGTLSADLAVQQSRVQSSNVIGKIPGTRHADETIMYSGHWDAYGIGTPDTQGRTVRPGANDDALGIAGIMEIARAFKAGPAPERTLVFAAWTGEERGLLGSEYYALNPIYPADRMAANLTLDILQTAGPARDVVLIGQGQSDLEDDLVRAAAAQGRTVTPDAQPQRGLFYRADHFSLAKRGVPVLLLMGIGGGADLIEGGRAAGDKWVSDYTANCYHQICDAWRADWDLRGAAQDVALLYTIGRDLAFSRRWPQWRSGSEFREVREGSAAARP
ncbi:MAG: M28 family peptidase [Sphingosinicella sp.]|nr:M28 family peptidase [Sphingosinicella sp.]